MDIQELAIKVAAEAAGAGIPLPGARVVVEALLKELLNVQDQQMAILSKIEEDVQRLIDGPWNTGRRYVRQATLLDRSPQQISESLQRASDCFIQAVDLQPAGSFRRAAVCLDVALVSEITGDSATTRLYATEADSEAASALIASVNTYLSKEKGLRSEVRKGAYSTALSLMTGISTKTTRNVVSNPAGKLYSSAFDQYKSVRGAAQALGGTVHEELASVKDPAAFSWSGWLKRRETLGPS